MLIQKGTALVRLKLSQVGNSCPLSKKWMVKDSLKLRNFLLFFNTKMTNHIFTSCVLSLPFYAIFFCTLCIQTMHKTKRKTNHSIQLEHFMWWVVFVFLNLTSKRQYHRGDLLGTRVNLRG